MKIIEYNHSYAPLVADMWNKSKSNWGNSEELKTEFDVVTSESNSGNIKLYLAIDEGLVVGYCSFSEYTHDVGASYLPLLNVVPEYHGKSVGKALILKVLDDAVSSEWSRFDLFTWSGNIKAMPLYKKCGFFWEKRNNTVHLMNFIPYLYQSQALLKYLADIDWYKDSKRVIDMQHDGLEINGFEYYRYDFQNDKTKLSFEFEKMGRGLRLIDTPDYSIKMTLPESVLVFPDEYAVVFEVENKSRKDLFLEIKGKDNKNIVFNFEYTENIVDTSVIRGIFTVNETDKKQQKGETHPVVEADLVINGESVAFKVGIEPKNPIDLTLNIMEYYHKPNKEYECFLDIENNLDKTQTITILPKNDFVTFKEISPIVLDSKEKQSIKVKYSVSKHGLYSQLAEIKYGDKIVNKRIFGLIKGINSSFICTVENKIFMVSGNYYCEYEKSENYFSLCNNLEGDDFAVFFAPQLGIPYNLEFGNANPIFKVINDNELDVIFNSISFDKINVIIHIKHYFGLLTVNYELKNQGKERTVSLSVPVWGDMSNTTVPFNNKLLEIDGLDGCDLGLIEDELMDENWIFNRKSNFGLSWDSTISKKVNEWKFSFDFENITLDNNSTYSTDNFYASFVHSNQDVFRLFAGYNEPRNTIGYFEVGVNKGNPFVSEKAEVALKINKKVDVVGTISIDQTEVTLDSSIKTTDGLKEISVSIKDRDFKYKKLIHKVHGTITSTDANGILEVSNGVLTFKASNVYADSIYSLVFNENEWLDSNYPKPEQRAWWGDFIGGITQRVSGMQDITAIKEKRTSEFISLKDNFNNEWQGIKISLIIETDKELKGLILDSYYVTLPGVPVLHSFTNIRNNSGKLYHNKYFDRMSTLNIDDNKQLAIVKNNDVSYKCNNISIELLHDKFVSFSGSREYKLGLYNAKNRIISSTQKGFNIVFSKDGITIPDGESKQFTGDYIIFTKDEMKKEYLKDLENIIFEV